MAARFPERNIRHVAAELRGLVGEADDQVDMHQLTKDPERLRADFPATAESPTVELTADELGRYLDYCSELLPLVAKGRRCARSRPRMRSCSTP